MVHSGAVILGSISYSGEALDRHVNVAPSCILSSMSCELVRFGSMPDCLAKGLLDSSLMASFAL